MIIDTVVETIPVVIKYDLVKDKEETFLSMTSLTVSEFDDLCKNFEETLNKRKSKDRENDESNAKNGGRPSVLDFTQDKLFFILFYLKNYPLQTTIGFIFGLSQPRANYWIHFLSGVLKETLETMNFMPKNAPSELLEKLESEGKQDFSIDGTERRINRPQDEEEQKKHYSGRKKTHTVKNIIIIGNSDREIKYLSDTVEGSKHDKKVIDESEVILPKGSNLLQDTGFQGYNPEGINTIQPKKKPKGKELTGEEKENNKLISRVRIVVEHIISGIKRLHIVKSVFRNTKENYDDLVMWLACGLHNFRNFQRIHSY
jgi:hypothetical protein